MSVSIAMATALLSRNGCSFPKPGRRGFQTRARSVIPWTAPWWCKARPCSLFTGPITLILIRVLLDVFGLDVFCWALFALAIHALPWCGGMTVGIYSFQTGASPFGAIVGGFVTAGFTLVVGRYAFSAARSRIVRLVIGLLFAVPAAHAGYDVTLALAHVGFPRSGCGSRSLCSAPSPSGAPSGRACR
jgi:hypothetical protein